jgi:hypothetical protein
MSGIRRRGEPDELLACSTGWPGEQFQCPTHPKTLSRDRSPCACGPAQSPWCRHSSSTVSRKTGCGRKVKAASLPLPIRAGRGGILPRDNPLASTAHKDTTCAAATPNGHTSDTRSAQWLSGNKESRCPQSSKVRNEIKRTEQRTRSTVPRQQGKGQSFFAVCPASQTGFPLHSAPSCGQSTTSTLKVVPPMVIRSPSLTTEPTV